MMNRMERAAALAMACFVMATGCGDGSPQPDAMDVVNQELVEADTWETDTAESDVHQDDVADPDVNVKEGAIGIDGGQLAVPSGPTLTVPAQALEDEVVISISRMTWTDPGAPENTEGDSLVPVGDIWVFEPDGLVFHKPATIVLPYNVTSAVGRDLEVFWSVGDTGKYEAVEGAQIANGLASFEVTHFSSGFVGFVVPVAEDPRLPEGMTFNAEADLAVNPVFVPTLKSNSTGTGMSSISAGMIMMYTSDCSALSEYFENGQVKTAVGVLCDPVDDDLFAVAGYSALPNDIDEVLFHLSDSGAWGVEVEMEPSLEAKYKNLRESQVQFEIFKDGELAAASTDYPGSVTVPGGWDTHGTLWESFDSVRFELPVGSELTPGDYTFRVIVGLYGFESAFTIE